MPKIEDVVLELAEPIAKQFGVRIYDVEFKKEGAEWYLRVFLYNKDGIKSEDCENVSRALSEEMDRVDPIKNSYILEVSSPGLNRMLTKDWHYEAAIGEPVEVRLYSAMNGLKKILGTLCGYEKNVFSIEIDNGEKIDIEQSKIAKIRLNQI